MRRLQGAFPCCKKHLPSNKDKRQAVLECIFFTHNFHTKIVGHNQVSDVFSPEYNRVINIHGYDWIRQYYLECGDYETEDEAELFEVKFGDSETE
jgi:hypothetical protein